MSPGRHTILVVDDDEDVLSLARTYLEGQGYNVLHAPNAAEGVQSCSVCPAIVTLPAPGTSVRRL